MLMLMYRSEVARPDACSQKSFLQRSCSELILVPIIIALTIAQSIFFGNTLTQLKISSLAGPALLAAYVGSIVCILLIISTFSSRKVCLLTAVPIIYWLVNTLNARSAISIDDVLLPLELCIFSMFGDEEKRQVYRAFRFYLLISSIIGIAISISYYLSFPISYEIAPYYMESSYSHSMYADYGMCRLLIQPGSQSFRLCGLFTEPGHFGTMLALAICADGCEYWKPSTIIMVIAGLLTSSLAFVIIVVSSIAIKNIADIKQLIVFFIVFIVAIWALSTLTTEGTWLYGILERLGIVGQGSFLDNRTNEQLANAFVEMGFSQWLFGYGSGFTSTLGTGNAGILVSIANNGIVGTCLIFIPLIYYAYKQSRGSIAALVLTTCFVISLYQRADVFELSYFVLLFGGIAGLQEQLLSNRSNQAG